MEIFKRVIFSVLVLISTCYSIDAMAMIKCGSEIGQPPGTLNIGFSASPSVVLKTAGVYDVRAVPDHGMVGNIVYDIEATCITDYDGPAYNVHLVFNGACMGISGLPEFEYEPTFCRAVINHMITDQRFVSSQTFNTKPGVPFHVTARVEVPVSLKLRHSNGSFTLSLNDVRDSLKHEISETPNSAGKDIFLGGQTISYNGPSVITFVTVPPTCVFELNDVDFQNQGYNEVRNNTVSPLHTTLSANCFNALTGVQLKFSSPNGYMQKSGVIKSNMTDLGFLLTWADNSLATKGMPLEFMRNYNIPNAKFTGGNTTTINLPIDVSPYYEAGLGGGVSGQARTSITAEINYW
ncbi:TPA: hypothetical protein NPN74_005189 [Klebsiella quasipneumoniae subsp. quasipneumoniae]|nr:hypothetical protein [Klebsiella quasipneumoniae subsp. quasipneumoniae]